MTAVHDDGSPAPPLDLAVVYRTERKRLMALAYRMLGSVGEAEDVTQEAFLRLRSAARREPIEDVPAYLTTVTTRLAIDRLTSARATREAYVGPWLPEPVLTAPDRLGGDPADHAELADSLSMAFLALLEALSPTERAVLILRDVFGYSSQETAAIAGITDANCRQVLVRARRRVVEGRPRFEADTARRDELVARFIRACQNGELADFLALLTDDVVLYSDGGGKVLAARRPVHGRQRVATFLARVMRRSRRHRRLQPAVINGQAGLLWFDGDRLVGVVSLDVVRHGLQAIRFVLNPDKLQHLEPGHSAPPAAPT